MSDQTVGTAKVNFRLIVSDPAVRVVVLIIFVIMLGFGIIAPILPLYARSFGVSYEAASLLISAFAFTRLISDPVVGPIVDRYGERVCSIIGVVVVGVSAVLAGLATSFPLVVVFRGAGGAGSSLLFAALYSYLLKVVPSQRMGRTMSVFYGALNVGIIAGGPLGGLIAHAWGLASPLFVYAGLCFLSGLLYLRFMPDPNVAAKGSPHPGPGAASAPPLDLGVRLWRRTRTQVVELMKSRAFVTVVVLNMVFFWVVAGGYDTLIPLFAREGLKVSPVGVGALFGVVVAGEFLVLYPAGSMADRIGRKPVLLVSLTGLAVMMAVLGLAGSPVVLGALLVILGLTSGSTAAAPAAMLSDVVPESGSGTAVGVFRFFGDLGFVLGPTVAGFTAGAFGFGWAFAIMALPALLALALVIRTPETLKAVRREHEPPAAVLD
ncbi:MAG TPA: MFS transporter [Actinomycetota bacterium]|jgi:MFS family permease